MKNILNYIICNCSIIVAIALILSGGTWAVAGFLWCGVLYVSGELFPALWKSFWVSNIRILKFFNCL